MRIASFDLKVHDYSGHYCEETQVSPIRFLAALTDKENKALHLPFPPMKCREFFNDYIFSFVTNRESSIYGFHVSKSTIKKFKNCDPFAAFLMTGPSDYLLRVVHAYKLARSAYSATRDNLLFRVSGVKTSPELSEPYIVVTLDNESLAKSPVGMSLLTCTLRGWGYADKTYLPSSNTRKALFYLPTEGCSERTIILQTLGNLPLQIMEKMLTDGEFADKYLKTFTRADSMTDSILRHAASSILRVSSTVYMTKQQIEVSLKNEYKGKKYSNYTLRQYKSLRKAICELIYT